MPAPPPAARPTETTQVLRASLVVSGLGGVAKLLGVVREAAAAAVFGATRAVDSFVVAKSLPDMVSTWIEVPVKAAFVPLFTSRRHEQGEPAAWAAASNVLNTLFLGLLLLVLLLELGGGLLVHGMSLGFRSQRAWEESASLTRILLASVFFSTGGVILASLSNVYGRQLVPGLARVAAGAVVLVAVLLAGPRLGLSGYAFGILAGSIVSFLIQCEVLWRHRRLYRFRLDPRASELRELLSKAWPLFVGLSATRIDVVLDRNFASFLPPGSLAILGYGLLLSVTVTELAVAVSGSVLLPHFSRLIAQRRYDEVRAHLGDGIETYLYFVLPLAAFVAGGARPLIDLVYGRGRFTPEDAALTALVVPVMALSDPFTGVGQVLAQVHIGAGDTRRPMHVGFVRLGIKVVLSVLLIGALGILGLAIAAAVANAGRAGLLWRSLRDELRPVDSSLGRRLAGLAAATALLVALTWGLFRVVPPLGAGIAGGVLRMVAIAGAVGAAWIALSAALGSRVAPRLIRRLRGR